MIVKEKPINIETSDNFQSHFFGIGDLSIIFDILRNKLYSNPIESCCREISSNAVDAHREAGKHDLPIQISLPSILDPYFKVKDWGIGISPERVENIFIKYAASTKRNTNDQRGYFGCGSKSPFSVSDSFTVETVVDGIKYNYACYIDETKVGKLSLLSKISTDADNGTEIIIPVKSADFTAFEDSVYNVCRFWKIKPIIKNGTITWEEPEISISGTNWFIINDDNYYNQAKLLVDEIEYPLDHTQLQSYDKITVFNALSGTLYLKFKTGELSLSANREAVHLDNHTQAKIIRAFNTVADELRASVQKKIDTCTSFWQANQMFNQEIAISFRNRAFLKPITWQGLEILYENLRIDVYKYGVYLYNFDNKSSRYNANSIAFTDNTLLLFNDFDTYDVKAKHLTSIWKDNPSIKRIVMISPYKIDSGKTTLKQLEKHYPLKALDIKLLSDYIDELPDLTAPVKIAKPRLTIFKFINDKFKRVPIDDLPKDKNEKIICALSKRWNGQRYVKHNNFSLSEFHLNTLLKKVKNVSFYGVDDCVPKDRIEATFPKAKQFTTFAVEILQNNRPDAIKAHFASIYGYENVDIVGWRKLIKDKKSSYLKYLETLNELHIDQDKRSYDEKWLYDVFIAKISDKEKTEWLKKHPELDVTEITKLITKQYPLIHQSGRSLEKANKDIATYINLIDKYGEDNAK